MRWFTLVLTTLFATAGMAASRPNIVIVFIDDMGFADVHPFGDPPYPTPNIERMAKEGRCFTDFQVSSPVCSASRAALMTGCYHVRVGIQGALGTNAEIGISDEETTLAELCRQQGYATACIGKWHLGHHPKFLPTEHGFDTFFGLPYSNDMWPYHPRLQDLPMSERLRTYPPLPLIENARVIKYGLTRDDQMTLTRKYTERAVDFIRAKRDRPFLLYLAHSMVHVPLHVSPSFQGASGTGLFGDAVMEVDWSVGQVLDTLNEEGLEDNTLVIFTSDNGPWLSYGRHAGSAAPFREGKGTTFEGGQREPTIMRWPGHIPANTFCDELAVTFDVLPTVAQLIGAPLPEQRIDGLDIRPLMFGGLEERSPHSYFCCYYEDNELQAIRDRRWKLHFPHRYSTLSGRGGGTDGIPADYERSDIGLALFDLKRDRAERIDVLAKHPDVVQRLQQAADEVRADLGDQLEARQGKGIRPAGTLLDGDREFRDMLIESKDVEPQEKQ